MFQNQNNNNNNNNNNDAVGVSITIPIDGAQHQQQQQQQQNINYNGVHANQNKGVRKKPYVNITEQPASKALRFRYECEGRSAGSIPGVNSSSENKTYPTIEIVGYKGRAVVVVSCVTKDQPYRPHPHNLVGKEGCKKGVCTLEINSETMRAVFSNLGIQCVKKKDIDSALKAREDIRVDPFKTGFSHRFQPSSIDLNVVRLCFQVFMESEQKGRFTQPLPPVVSDPIYDKKAMSDLVICRLCSCSATVLGSTQIILLCEKVAKEDIAIRFFEEKNNQVIWEAYGEFQHTDVHKQTAITFKTPRYRSLDITEPAKVFLQLRRPSDGVTSEALPFEYIPLDSGRQSFWSLRRNLKRKPDLELFEHILNVDSERVIEEPIVVNHIVTDLDAPSVQAETTTTTANSVEYLNSTEIISEQAAQTTSQQDLDNILNEKVRELELQQNAVQENQAFAQEDIIMEVQLEHPQQKEQQQELEQLQFPAQICTTDKINEWMEYNETQNLVDANNEPQKQTKENIVMSSKNESNIINDDKTLNELLEQVVELDEIYSDHVHRRNSNELQSNEYAYNKAIGTLEHNKSLDRGESFDDAATYSSLQIAFKHPISIPNDSIMTSTQIKNSQYNFPNTDLGTQQQLQLQQQLQYIEQQQNFIQSIENNNIMHYDEQHQLGNDLVDSKHTLIVDDKKLPPLPPKRMRKPDTRYDMNNRTNDDNEMDKKQNETTIFIMKTPDQGPSPRGSKTKINTIDQNNQNVACKQKKSGFFSKIFSRRKSKPELSQDEINLKSNSKLNTPYDTREPSIQHFPLNDVHRSSMRSVKSMQVSSLPTSPNKVLASSNKSIKTKISKPVGRSVSSVSGKRPAHLNADVIHIPLKGESVSSLPQNNNNNNNNSEAYSHASTITLDRRTVSALQLADIPISDGHMELVAIADRQSLRNLCDGEANIQLDPNVDLTEAEHFALYTSIPPQATASEFDENSAYYAVVDASEILTPNEIAKRLSAANRSK